MNIHLANRCLEKLAELGVKDILLCAGARNAPLVYLLENSKGFQVTNFFEERSAAFFALGKTQASGHPVAIITTSGTAVAELLPAAVEATYTRTPVIFVTADRPRSYRGTGAPQTIDQVGILSTYVETCVDIEREDEKFDFSLWTKSGPLQINLCFGEPLIDAKVEAIDYSKFYQDPKKLMAFKPTRNHIVDQPIVIAGPLSQEEAGVVAPILEKWGVPIYAEAISNLRGIEGLQRLFLKSGDQIVKNIFLNGQAKSVIRVGGVPTLRFWRDLEEQFSQIPVTAVSNQEFSGLSRSSRLLVGLENINAIQIQWSQDQRKEIFSADSDRYKKLNELLEKYPESETSLFAKLARHTSGNFVYLGNSLPIREWDLASGYLNLPLRQAGNRGANGIDGQLSSFLGGCDLNVENWGIFGDLTTMYDLSAPWAARVMPQHKIRLVVINNSGGMIFKEMFQKEIFLNQHQISFQKWAEMWGWSYQKWQKIPEQIALEHQVIIEVTPDPEQSQKFWKDYKAIS